MNKATIIEIVLFKINEGVNLEDFKEEMIEYNHFLLTQAGFISRQIGLSADGQFLDVALWADMKSAEKSGENLDQNPKMAEFFNSTMGKIDQKTLSADFFKIVIDTFAQTDNATIIEILRFKTKEGVNSEKLRAELIEYSDYLLENGKQTGYLSGKIGMSAGGEYLDMSHWKADLQSSEPPTAEMEQFFNSLTEKIDEKTMSNDFFEIISSTSIKSIK